MEEDNKCYEQEFYGLIRLKKKIQAEEKRRATECILPANVSFPVGASILNHEEEMDYYSPRVAPFDSFHSNVHAEECQKYKNGVYDDYDDPMIPTFPSFL